MLPAARVSALPWQRHGYALLMNDKWMSAAGGQLVQRCSQPALRRQKVLDRLSGTTSSPALLAVVHLFSSPSLALTPTLLRSPAHLTSLCLLTSLASLSCFICLESFCLYGSCQLLPASHTPRWRIQQLQRLLALVPSCLCSAPSLSHAACCRWLPSANAVSILTHSCSSTSRQQCVRLPRAEAEATPKPA